MPIPLVTRILVADDHALGAAMRGQSFLYPSAVNTLVRDFLDRAATESDYDPLTPRELEVLKLSAECKTSNESPSCSSSASRWSSGTAPTSCTGSACATAWTSPATRSAEA